MKKQILLMTVSVMPILFANAQSMIGKWKTLGMTVENIDGSKTDLRSMQLKHWPCLSEMETVFEANGKEYSRSPKNCGMIDYNKIPPADWKLTGNTLSLTDNGDMPNPLGKTATYAVSFSGNKVTLTHVYTSEEKAKLHTPKAKQTVLVYQRS